MKRFNYDGLLKQWKVKLALNRARRMGFRDDELDDVIQELALTLMGVKYHETNANGASEKTVLTSIIDRQLFKMRRDRACRERYEARVALSGDETYDNEDIRRRLDVETVVGKLDGKQRQVCDLLSQGYPKSAIAEQLGCGWHAVDRIVRDIRGQFEVDGFGEDR